MGLTARPECHRVLLGLLELRQLVATVALVSYSEVRWHRLPGSSQDKVLVAILLCEDSHPGQSYPGQKMYYISLWDTFGIGKDYFGIHPNFLSLF